MKFHDLKTTEHSGKLIVISITWWTVDLGNSTDLFVVCITFVQSIALSFVRVLCFYSTLRLVKFTVAFCSPRMCLYICRLLFKNVLKMYGLFLTFGKITSQ